MVDAFGARTDLVFYALICFSCPRTQHNTSTSQMLGTFLLNTLVHKFELLKLNILATTVSVSTAEETKKIKSFPVANSKGLLSLKQWLRKESNVKTAVTFEQVVHTGNLKPWSWCKVVFPVGAWGQHRYVIFEERHLYSRRPQISSNNIFKDKEYS